MRVLCTNTPSRTDSGLRKCVPYTRAGAAAIILFHRLRHIIEIGERRNV